MKLPKTFRMEKDLDGKIDDLLSSESLVYDPRLVEDLLCVGEEFLEHEWANYEGFYHAGVDLVSELKYGLKDVEELSKRIKHGQSKLLGIYLSVLINKKITEKDIVTLTLEEKLDGVGMYLQKGTLIINGNVNDSAGYGMRGGELVVEGDANNYTGCYMMGGGLVVKGNANDFTGYFMGGGELVVKGNANDYTGYFMKGGNLVVEGNANNNTGRCMENGKIVVEGNANYIIGSYMEGGKIVVGGKISGISNDFRSGVIIEGGRIRRDC